MPSVTAFFRATSERYLGPLRSERSKPLPTLLVDFELNLSPKKKAGIKLRVVIGDSSGPELKDAWF